MTRKIKLGDEIEDIVTGFKGIAIAKTSWLYGCDRITIQPKVDKEGKNQDNETFDEESVRLIKKEKVKGDTRKEKTGGDQNDKAALRRNDVSVRKRSNPS